MKNKSKYESEYVEADKYVVINGGDVDLKPIVLSLPKPPPLHTIEGYGIPAKEQRFQREVIPRKLINLELEAIAEAEKDKSKNVNNVITIIKIQKKFWDLVNSRNKELKNEINFIRRMWWQRIHGKWIFINGKPTYLTGRFFYYLNFFTMDTKEGKPDYRDCDRREYLFKEYCWTSTESFAKIDEHGYAIKNDDGTYDMVDLGRRICFGDGQPKNRRRGNTSKACSDGLEVTTRTFGTSGFGIQSYTEDSAKGHFKDKVLPAWNGLPVWMKPYSTSGRTSDSLKLDVEKNEYGEIGLGTQVVYATTSSAKSFDGKKMAYLLTDEEGKTSNCSVSERWGVNKHTLAQGDGMIIRAYASHPSTVDQLTDGSGDYQFLISSSNFYRRIKSKGQTLSGLFRIFIPAQDGLEGFIDSYGYSVTGTILPHQKEEGFTQTAEDFLQGELDVLSKENTPESMKKYREHKQLFPMCYADSWMGSAGDIGFDVEKIDRRLAELRRESNAVRGNLEWVNGEFGGEVEFVPDSEKGRFNVSRQPFEHARNKKVLGSYYNAFEQKMEEHWMPMYPDSVTVGIDTFRLGGKGDERVGKTLGKSSKLSDGGIVGFWNYDDSLDKGKPKSEWESYKFIFTYRERSANTDTFNEDALKACVYWGALAFPETNIVNTYEYFVKKGFGNYLLYDIDKFTGKLKEKPGVDSLERSKQEMFSLWRDYIDARCHKEEHEELLRECKDIRGIEQMRFFDLIAAGGCALMGSKSPYAGMVKDEGKNDFDAKDYWDL